MCTVSVITRNHGYLLAMNRDESIARGAGEPPEIHLLRGTAVIYPSDGAGGTWISANEYGITLALLNWNDVTRPVLNRSKIRSRGQIIPALASASSLAALQAAFGALDLEGIRPFRLVGVFPRGQSGTGVGIPRSSHSILTAGNPATGFPPAFRTDRPGVYVAPHARTRATNPIAAQSPGCESFTPRTREQPGHSVCASTATA